MRKVSELGKTFGHYLLPVTRENAKTTWRNEGILLKSYVWNISFCKINSLFLPCHRFKTITLWLLAIFQQFTQILKDSASDILHVMYIFLKHFVYESNLSPVKHWGRLIKKHIWWERKNFCWKEKKGVDNEKSDAGNRWNFIYFIHFKNSVLYIKLHVAYVCATLYDFSRRVFPHTNGNFICTPRRKTSFHNIRKIPQEWYELSCVILSGTHTSNPHKHISFI